MSNDADEAYVSGLPGILGMLDGALARFEAVLLAVGVLLMAINTVANSVGRFIFSHSLFFSEELNSILIVWITFAGLSYAARYGRHIRMSAIFDTLSMQNRRRLMALITLLTGLLLLLLSWFALQYVLSVKSSGRLLPAMSIPVWWAYVYVPVGFLMTAILYLLTALKNLTSTQAYLSTQVPEGYADDDIGL